MEEETQMITAICRNCPKFDECFVNTDLMNKRLKIYSYKAFVSPFVPIGEVIRAFESGIIGSKPEANPVHNKPTKVVGSLGHVSITSTWTTCNKMFITKQDPPISESDIAQAMLIR